MDADRFDALLRSLSASPSRRTTLRLLVGPALGSLLALVILPTNAKKKGGKGKGKKGKQRKRPNTGDRCSKRDKCCCGNVCQNRRCCVPPGLFCLADEECCSGACGDSAECLCPGLAPHCGGTCCNPLTQQCQDGHCVPAGCPPDLPIPCGPTPEVPEGWCCPPCTIACSGCPPGNPRCCMIDQGNC
jgi:hypothetical protein